MIFRLLVSGLSAAAIVAASLGVVTSEAAWSDVVHASVEVRAGTWDPDPEPEPDPELGAVECYPVGTEPPQSGTCRVTNVRFSFHGDNYQVNFGLTSDSSTPFEWEVRFDLDSLYPDHLYTNLSSAPHYDHMRMFPGAVVPGGTVWSPWVVEGFSSWSMCAATLQEEIPVVIFRGNADWNRRVGGGISYGLSTFGFQPSSGNTQFPNSCPG